MYQYHVARFALRATHHRAAQQVSSGLRRQQFGELDWPTLKPPGTLDKVPEERKDDGDIPRRRHSHSLSLHSVPIATVSLKGSVYRLKIEWPVYGRIQPRFVIH